MSDEPKHRSAPMRLHWRERLELYVAVILAFSFFFWLYEYRADRLETRMYYLFNMDARMDAMETWQCQKFNHGCLD